MMVDMGMMVVVLKILVMMLIMMEIVLLLMLSLALRVVQRRTLGSTGTAGMMFSQVRPISHLHLASRIPACRSLILTLAF